MFFNLNDTMLETCPESARIGTRDVCIVACDPPEACAGDNFCSIGYASKAPMYRCGSCADRYYRRAGGCAKCPDSPVVLIVIFIVAAIVAALFGLELNRRNVNIAFISIGIDYFQVLAMFANSRVHWPSFVKDIFHVLSAFNLNLEITAPECSIPDLGYQAKWMAMEFLPIAAAVLACLVFLVQAGYQYWVAGQRGRERVCGHGN